MTDNTVSREDLQDVLQAFANYRSQAGNTEAQLHLELAKAHRRVAELERAAQPQSNVVNLPSADSEAA